jgi:hypothetical protein
MRYFFTLACIFFSCDLYAQFKKTEFDAYSIENNAIVKYIYKDSVIAIVNSGDTNETVTYLKYKGIYKDLFYCPANFNRQYKLDDMIVCDSKKHISNQCYYINGDYVVLSFIKEPCIITENCEVFRVFKVMQDSLDMVNDLSCSLFCNFLYAKLGLIISIRYDKYGNPNFNGSNDGNIYFSATNMITGKVISKKRKMKNNDEEVYHMSGEKHHDSQIAMKIL